MDDCDQQQNASLNPTYRKCLRGPLRGHQRRFCRFADMSVIRRIADSVMESSNARQDNADLGELSGL